MVGEGVSVGLLDTTFKHSKFQIPKRIDTGLVYQLGSIVKYGLCLHSEYAC